MDSIPSQNRSSFKSSPNPISDKTSRLSMCDKDCHSRVITEDLRLHSLGKWIGVNVQESLHIPDLGSRVNYKIIDHGAICMLISSEHVAHIALLSRKYI